MDDQQIQTIKSAVAEASADGIKQTLISLGFDVKNPLELQKDLAHLREQRIAREQITTAARRTLLAAALTGLISLVVLGIKHMPNT